MQSAHASVNQTIAEVADTSVSVQGSAASTEVRDGR
jgi:hypothetical protein